MDQVSLIFKNKNIKISHAHASHKGKLVFHLTECLYFSIETHALTDSLSLTHFHIK